MSPVKGTIASILLACFLLSANAEVEDPDWWKTALVYQIYPKSFKDSDGDGYGDLQGIISTLPFLKEAGVTAAWLSPIYKSPQVDDGYDISDFKQVDEIFGTLDDFDQLVANATELGIKIVMDLVPNHSSDEHEWFALSANRTEGFEDFYVWVNGSENGTAPPNNWISVFKNSAWTYNEERGQYYLHQFTPQQPDLNYNDPTVVNEMTDVLTFWLDRGVAGFRIDAVSHIYETGLEDEPESGDESAQSNEYGYLSHVYTKDQNETFQLIYSWRDMLDKYSEEKGDYSRIIMTEAATDISYVMRYYGDEDTGELGAHFSFNFNLLGTFTSARDVVNSVNYWMAYMPVAYTANWLTGNHDNHRVATRNGPQTVDGYNMLLAMLPGVMITYNGEEIGQENGEVSFEDCKDPSACDSEENFYANSRDFARTPYQWDNSTNAGFSEGNSTWLPVSEKYLQTNLAFQSEDGVRSHYHIYQGLIELRKEEALTDGTYSISAISDNILALARKISGGLNYTLVLNLNNVTETVNLTAAFSTLDTELEVLLASVNSTRGLGDLVDPSALEMEPYESLILLQRASENETSTSTETPSSLSTEDASSSSTGDASSSSTEDASSASTEDASSSSTGDASSSSTESSGSTGSTEDPGEGGAGGLSGSLVACLVAISVLYLQNA